MYVTSDIFDLNEIGRECGFEWHENLVCGVAAHGAKWPSPDLAARFLVEASEVCHLSDAMQYAGYSVAGRSRTINISPRTLRKLSNANANHAPRTIGVLLTGEMSAIGTENGKILFGGEVSGSLKDDFTPGHNSPNDSSIERPFSTYFLFPFDDNYIEISGKLLSLAGNILGCDYGYSYIRDEFCLPAGYDVGVAPSLDFADESDREAVEIDSWSKMARTEYWRATLPLMRDLYEVNLISEKRSEINIDGVNSLPEWIHASRRRGNIQELPHGRMLWKVTDAEMASIRPILKLIGALHQCPARIYRDI